MGETGSRFKSDTAPATVIESWYPPRACFQPLSVGLGREGRGSRERSSVRRPAWAIFRALRWAMYPDAPRPDRVPANRQFKITNMGTTMRIHLFTVLGLLAVDNASADPTPIEELTITERRWAPLALPWQPGRSVIARAEIEASARQDLIDLLRTQPGVDIARNGGPGGATSVFLRGSNSNHVLVLIDGIRAAAAGTGALQWENLPLAQIERIEIVRGPQASFYGSDAIGGIVNVVTRRTEQTSVYLEAGSNDSRRAEISIGDRQNFWLTVGHQRTDGFDATTADSFFNNPDDDGFELNSLTAGLTRRIGSQQFQATLLSREGDVEFDQGESENRSHQLAFRLGGELSPGVRHMAQLGIVDDELSTPTFGSRFDTRRYELDWQLSLGNPDSMWTLGINAVEEQGESRNEFDLDRDNLAAFLGWDFHAGLHRFSFSARHDDNRSENTGRAAWELELTPAWRLHASHATAFRLPNFNELFSPGFPIGDPPLPLFAGNPDLQAEQSQSSELGLSFTGGNSAFSITGYRSEIDDLIAFQGENFAAVNVANADIEGIEVVYQWQTEIWQLDTNASWLNAEDGFDQPLLRRADEKASLRLRRNLGPTWLGMEWSYTGERPDFDRELDDFSLINLTAGYRLGSAWQVTARLENLFDEDYQLASGFQAPERSAWVGLRWRGQ